MYLSSLSSRCFLLFSYSAKRSFLHTNHTVFVTATRPLYNKPVASQDQHQVFSGSYVALVRKRIPAILEKKQTGQYNVKRDNESYFFFSSVAGMRFCTLIIFKNSNQILYVPGFPTRGQQTFFEKRILRTWSISCCRPPKRSLASRDFVLFSSTFWTFKFKSGRSEVLSSHVVVETERSSQKRRVTDEESESLNVPNC